MNQELFAQTLHTFLHRQPFTPFLVELENGARVYIDVPKVVHKNGEVVFTDPQDGPIEFLCAEVRDLREAPENLIKEEQFRRTLRQFVQREPFLPFVVELTTGKKIVVEEPTVAFGGGVAGYFSPSFELINFHCDNVKQIRLATQEVPS
jgi:hypothetical protein